MALFGCPNCRIRGETGTWPVITVLAEKAWTGDGGTLGHQRIVCRICSGPLQALSKKDLERDKQDALVDELEQRIEPSFLDLITDDERERSGLPPVKQTPGNRAGVGSPQGASVESMS